MTLLTYNEILTVLCDNFDVLISPRTMARSNTNIVYLLFKAIAKGFEIINSICVVLSNKFNPASCSEEDLISVASLVGTERLAGSASGLEILVSNPTEESITLLMGFYKYDLDDDTSFVFEVLSDTVIPAGQSKSYIAMTEEVGQFPVTAQAEISVTYLSGNVPEGLKFSCTDNSALLGTSEETVLAFRQRILEDTTRQDTIKELEMKLKNLPYLFDAKIVFNNTSENTTVAGYTLPPFTMLIFYEGSPRNDIANIVASSNIYPTLHTPTSDVLRYYNDIFVNGYYEVNVTPFVKLNYELRVGYSIDHTYISTERAQAEIGAFLYNNFRGHSHVDYIKEEDIYNKLRELSIAGVTILNIDIYYNDTQVPFLTVPVSDIPYLEEVTFSEV